MWVKPRDAPFAPADQAWRASLHGVIFAAETRAGRTFDVILLIAIIGSVIAVSLETVPSIAAPYARALLIAEWVFTLLFTVEYVVRLVCVRRPLRYATSFWGVVDLLAILPTYLSLLFPGAQGLLVIRGLRLLRVFRIMKLARYVGEATVLRDALVASRPKITVFLFAVLMLVVVMGAVMYLVEGPENGFTSIPIGMYWAIVTLTTVGFGDITPHTPLGQLIASVLMVCGYGIIAVPTGIVTAELTRGTVTKPVSARACHACGRDGHDADAEFCKFCGAEFPDEG